MYVKLAWKLNFRAKEILLNLQFLEHFYGSTQILNQTNKQRLIFYLHIDKDTYSPVPLLLFSNFFPYPKLKFLFLQSFAAP